MPYNGSGTYSAPSSSWNPAVPNTAITSDDWNALLSDMSLALTGCVTKDGQSTTSARVPFAVGVSATGSAVSAVAYSRTDDANTGVYFPAADEVGIAAGGVAVMTATATTVTFPVAVTFSGSPSIAGNLTVTGNLVVNGNTTIGNAAGDTLTVAATGTFSGNQTFNGTATFTSTVTVPDASFSNAKLANMATQTIKGRTTAGSGAPEDLTATQATAILNNFVGDSGSGGTKGLVPAPAAGDAAQKDYLQADGTWGNEMKAWGLFTGSTGATVAARNLSCVRNSPGIFTFTFGTALANANYCLIVQPVFDNATNGMYQPVVSSKTSTGFAIQVIGDPAGAGPVTGFDPNQINVQVIA